MISSRLLHSENTMYDYYILLCVNIVRFFFLKKKKTFLLVAMVIILRTIFV